jgi:UDP-N-acetylglucosamine--N-acetylmuramyl-(pentapeptide) pyrophosphoryl-undecaprenol N-acetylglucosamine transferase
MHLLILLSRAGASSVSGCIVEAGHFIPSPNVAEDHQTKNAKAIVDKKGTFIESELESQFSVVLKHY